MEHGTRMHFFCLFVRHKFSNKTKKGDDFRSHQSKWKNTESIEEKKSLLVWNGARNRPKWGCRGVISGCGVVGGYIHSISTKMSISKQTGVPRCALLKTRKETGEHRVYFFYVFSVKQNPRASGSSLLTGRNLQPIKGFVVGDLSAVSISPTDMLIERLLVQANPGASCSLREATGRPCPSPKG